jgi:hypothetical protein
MKVYPVRSRCVEIYERAAIIDRFNRGLMLGPVSGDPLKPPDLFLTILHWNSELEKETDCESETNYN